MKTFNQFLFEQISGQIVGLKHIGGEEAKASVYFIDKKFVQDTTKLLDNRYTNDFDDWIWEDIMICRYYGDINVLDYRKNIKTFVIVHVLSRRIEVTSLFAPHYRNIQLNNIIQPNQLVLIEKDIIQIIPKEQLDSNDLFDAEAEIF